LAGCNGIVGGGSGGGGVTVGLNIPLSGAFSPTGERIENGVQFAVDTALDRGVVDDVEILTADTQTDPSVSQRNAQEHIRDGADVLTGYVADPVGRSAAQVAAQENKVIFAQGGPANLETNLENCLPTLYSAGWAIPGYVEGGLGYCIRSDRGDIGKKVFFISSDFSWPNAMQQYSENTLLPEANAEKVGESQPPLGETDFSSHISQAENSDADVVVFNQWGSDLQNALNQAEEFGLLEDKVAAVPGMSDSFAESINVEVFQTGNVYANVEWVPGVDTPEAEEFLNRWQENVSGLPSYEGTHFYVTMYTYLRSVEAAGTTETDEVQAEMDGRPWEPAIYPNPVSFRRSDKRPNLPAMTVNSIREDDKTFHRDNVVSIESAEDRMLFDTDRTACVKDGTFEPLESDPTPIPDS
jgi:ABC-type branched-subunit amino acid transport system substrate-binding protein